MSYGPGEIDPSQSLGGGAPSQRPPAPSQVTFSRRELNRILDLYGRKVAAGEWRDYVTRQARWVDFDHDYKTLDLTYMEYELLKFLASHPGKVFTREQLLSRVWGYEYYGGARTVDVHIRRLRAKLGEEHANLIQTVRSVGYRFGQSRWGI